MEGFIEGGQVADLILALLALEALALLGWRRITGRGLPPADVVALLLPGAFLVLALRLALTSGDWVLIPAALIGALAAHLFDLIRRLRG